MFPGLNHSLSHGKTDNALPAIDSPTNGILSWSPTALRLWHIPTRFVGRNPPKRTLRRQGYGGTHRAFIHGFTPVGFCKGG
jgi:hypothetical protein